MHQTDTRKYERLQSQPENPFSKLITEQEIAVVPSFTLESGVTLYNVPVAYTTRGKLSPEADNAMIICHALSGSADVADWWGPLLGGPGRAFDVSRFFVVCINSLGSPYGTASPVTSRDGDSEQDHYGPEFPLTTIRDDVRLAKLILDDLGVKQIATVVGGSMGGMNVLEYAYLGKDYVRSIIPMATSARHSAWCISWGEAQRQSIYSDPKYMDGYYPFNDPPSTGLGAARMSALLTYRSRDSFETRFGRNVPDASKHKDKGIKRPGTPADDHFAIHNDGHKLQGSPKPNGHSRAESRSSPPPPKPTEGEDKSEGAIVNGGSHVNVMDPEIHGATPMPTVLLPHDKKKATHYFSAQSYLRYQGDKFIHRYDANCYISITRKLDTHDVSFHNPNPGSADPIGDALGIIEQPTLVLGIESDGLFTFNEQKQIAEGIPGARLEKIESPEGHDAFLLQFEQVNKHITGFLAEVLPHIMEREPIKLEDGTDGEAGESGVGKLTKSSVFGEAEVEDITAW